MKKYELSEFRDKLVTEMNTFLYENGSEYQFSSQTISIGGVEGEYLVFSEPFTEPIEGGKSLDAGIALELEVLYSYYNNGDSIKDIAEKSAKRCLARAEEKTVLVDFFENVTPGEILEHISVRLISDEKKKQKGFSYVRPWNDLYIALDVTMEKDGHQFAFCLTDDAISFLSIPTDEAFEIAFNHVKEEEHFLFDMPASLIEALQEAGIEAPEDMITNLNSLFLYSNMDIHYGTKMVFKKKPLRMISKKLDSDLYLCPSSVHEWMVFSAKQVPLSVITKVHTDMHEKLDPNMRLSNSIYIYKREFDTVGQVAVLNYEKEV